MVRSEDPATILIAGGGIVGLVLAMSIKQQIGVTAEIYEKAHTFADDVGAGLGMVSENRENWEKFIWYRTKYSHGVCRNNRSIPTVSEFCVISAPNYCVPSGRWATHTSTVDGNATTELK